MVFKTLWMFVLITFWTEPYAMSAVPRFSSPAVDLIRFTFLRILLFLSIKILFSDFFFLLVEYTPNAQLKFPL